ncbi:MAG: MFS transporter [Geminicoccaceae bacterium]
MSFRLIDNRLFRFLVDHWRWLVFGLLLTFTSSFGQTYFIGLYGDVVREGFGLSHGNYGGLYAIGTLIGALGLFLFGGAIDRIDVRVFVGLVLAVLAGACLALSFAASVWALALAFAGLRFAGQGMCGHAAMTVMARRFGPDRGKAISVAALGLTIGEAVLPLLAIALLLALGWRTSWGLFAILILVVLLPVCIGLPPKGQPPPPARSGGANEAPGAAALKSSNRREVLSDWRFQLLVLPLFCPAFIFTGFFFHSVYMFAAKGWAPGLLATGLLVYALAKVASGLLSGLAVDRFGAARTFHISMPLMALALAVLALSTSPVGGLIFMVLLGVHVGVHMTAVPALWPELYGTHYLGAIKSMAGTFGVLSSAIAPAVYGWAFDGGLTVVDLAWITMGVALAGWILTIIALRGSIAHQPAAGLP